MKKTFFLIFLSFLIIGCTQEIVEELPPNTGIEPPQEDFVVEEVFIEEPEQKVEVEILEETSSVKEFNVVAKKWDFEPSEIKVNKGDTVKLKIESIDVTHGISLPAFKVNENLMSGETVEIEFTADKTGEFPFFCSVFCGSGHGKMKGTLIVE
jgi:nitrosocyanin